MPPPVLELPGPRLGRSGAWGTCAPCSCACISHHLRRAFLSFEAAHTVLSAALAPPARFTGLHRAPQWPRRPQWPRPHLLGPHLLGPARTCLAPTCLAPPPPAWPPPAWPRPHLLGPARTCLASSLPGRAKPCSATSSARRRLEDSDLVERWGEGASEGLGGASDGRRQGLHKVCDVVMRPARRRV